MKKIITYTLKVGITALFLSPIFSMATLYIRMGLVYLAHRDNWSFSANIDLLDIALITVISSLVLPFVTYRVSRTAPGVYNMRSQITVSTLFFAVPLAFLYFFIFHKAENYSLSDILMMVIPSFLALVLCIGTYWREPKMPVQQIDAE